MEMIGYKVIGDLDEGKNNLVCIHGAGGSSTMFFKQLRALRPYFNLILVDLRGHGKSYNKDFNLGDDFNVLALDIVSVANKLGLKEYYVLSLSLGTLVNMALSNIDVRVKDSILIGATVELNKVTKGILRTVYKSRNVIPYKTIYHLCALAILPKLNHKESRNLFIKEFGKVKRKTFKNWLSLAVGIDNRLYELREGFKDKKGLFITGDEDYLFKVGVREYIYNQGKDSLLNYKEIERCGHVCNIDKPNEVNDLILNYFK